MRRGDGKREGWKKEDMGTPHWFWLRRTIHSEDLLELFPQYSLTEQTHMHTNTHTYTLQSN